MDKDLTIDLSQYQDVGENIKAFMEDTLLVLIIDTSKNIGPSQSGKMILTASTGGFALFPGGLKGNINIGKSRR